MPRAPEPLARLLDTGRTIRVGILLFPDVEVLDFAGPFEVFSVAARITRHARTSPVFEVATVAARPEPVRARHGLMVTPSHGFADAPAFDLFVVPGGVVTQPIGDAETLAYLTAAAAHAALTASVCTGAFLLARIGRLDGRRATTHWEDIPEFRETFPAVSVVEGVAFVDEGAIVTSAGISAGIEMSLHLVGRILGEEAARRTARQMQYDRWPG
jgi:transcriptional regulator GlxA family with amidase domain